MKEAAMNSPEAICVHPQRTIEMLWEQECVELMESYLISNNNKNKKMIWSSKGAVIRLHPSPKND